jgi:hypothetical protein
VPVKLFAGILSGRVELVDWARESLEQKLGLVDVESPMLRFDYTDYYRKEMGGGLVRKFFGFACLVDPLRLVEVKLESAVLEGELGRLCPELARPVNIDPGYVSASKVVLSTFKDYAHRIYLGQGVYAETTLHYYQGGFADWPWTYPDYRSDSYKTFFQRMREVYLLQLKDRSRASERRLEETGGEEERLR